MIRQHCRGVTVFVPAVTSAKQGRLSVRVDSHACVTWTDRRLAANRPYAALALIKATYIPIAHRPTAGLGSEAAKAVGLQNRWGHTGYPSLLLVTTRSNSGNSVSESLCVPLVSSV